MEEEDVSGDLQVLVTEVAAGPGAGGPNAGQVAIAVKGWLGERLLLHLAADDLGRALKGLRAFMQSPPSKRAAARCAALRFETLVEGGSEWRVGTAASARAVLVVAPAPGRPGLELSLEAEEAQRLAAALLQAARAAGATTQ